MEAPRKPGPFTWLRRLEARLDAWASRKLTAEEFAEAREADARMKRNFGRIAAAFFATCAGVGLLLYAMKPAFGLGEALGIAFLLCLGLGICFISAFFGYRRFVGPHGWKKLGGVLALAALGVVTGMFSASRMSGKPLPDSLGGGMRVAAIALLLGALLATAIAGIALMRVREGRQREARLKAEAEAERASRQTMQAELKVLQAQVEPHFLFNTLASVRYLVQSGSADALPMLDHVIQYLRSALPEIRTETSTLGREAQLARSYLAIMRMRVGPRFDFAIDVPVDLEHAPFPPLMLLTLVENAVKHGLVPRGGGHIHVRARRADDKLRVMVSDDGSGVGGAIGKGVGLANTRERLRALYGDAARLDIASGQGGGTIAAIEVPLA
jgi:hypothetical protein